MSKKTITREILYRNYLGILYEQLTLKEIQDKLAKAFEDVAKAYPEYDVIKIEFEIEDYYGTNSLKSKFFGEREETDGEYQERIEKEAKNNKAKEFFKRRQEEAEKDLYAKLKAKYEPNV